MDRKILALSLAICGCLYLAACQSSGLDQSFSAQIPVDGVITFTD